MALVKSFTAQTDIGEYCPVTAGTEEMTVKAMSGPTELVMGVAQKAVKAGEIVDVVMHGETVVDCEGAVDCSAPLGVNANGKACLINLEAEPFSTADADAPYFGVIGMAIENATSSAMLNAFVNPYVIKKEAAATETVTEQA